MHGSLFTFSIIALPLSLFFLLALRRDLRPAADFIHNRCALEHTDRLFFRHALIQAFLSKAIDVYPAGMCRLDTNQIKPAIATAAIAIDSIISTVPSLIPLLGLCP